MTDMMELFRTVDSLSEDELKQLQDYVEKRAQILNVWVVKPENLREVDDIMRSVQDEAASMMGDEINQVIDQAIAGVRRERREKTSGD